MALQYTLDRNLVKYEQIVDEYLQWYRRLSDYLLYADDAREDDIVEPQSLREWIDIIDHHGYVSHAEIKKLKNLNEQLLSLGNQFLDQVKGNKQPLPADQFKMLNLIYDQWIRALSWNHRSSFLENAGFDVFSGLRNYQAMIKDLSIELERLSRGGTPFTAAMVRIDCYSDIVQNYTKEELSQIVRTLSGLILECLRSFDDAYCCGEGEFLLCMKQSDIHGGIAALQRLNTILDEQNILVEIQGETKKMTISSCIAEPIPEDDVDQLFNFLKDDLNNSTAGTKGSVIEYAEVSPIERYFNSLKTDMKDKAVDSEYYTQKGS